MTRLIDQVGLELTVSSLAAVHAWDDLVTGYLCHAKSTPAALNTLLETDPNAPLGWAAKALMSVMMARPELMPAAREAAANARRLAANGTAREVLYGEAAQGAVDGRWKAAVASLERVLAVEPDDSFAAKASHAMRFMLGDKEGMLASIESTRPRITPGHPHAGYYLGCEAFALEEAGLYERAEKLGRKALELAPRDAWGLHAVAHVHEMTGRMEAGAAWLEERHDNFSHCNNFAGHLFWHLALFHLERGDHARVLDLYDRSIRAEQTEDFRDVANAVSLLARLELAQVDVGNRWGELVDIAGRRVSDGCLVFADLHHVLAMARAGRGAAAITGFNASLDRRPDEQRQNAALLGTDVAEGFTAFCEGRFGPASDMLLRARHHMQRIGGSHAQRDLFEQITIEACLRAGRTGVAQGILEERLRQRGGHNSFAETRLSSIRAHLGESNGGVAAMGAMLHAPTLE
jgi:tetratricopeptide (TPR) repeat protein